MRYIIISNRLPVTVVTKGDKLRMTRSGGGLATGLDSLDTSGERHWLGWAGLHVDDEEKQKKIRAKLKKRSFHPVFLSPEYIRDYYEGYSNSTLWPLCHYFFSYINCDQAYWKAYKEVNALFCREALKIIRPDDVVWVHDYQLMLLPAMLREHLPNTAIGYFHHIPFPAYELFRYLPERAELLRGLLGADQIGFHVHDYVRHFISALYRVLDLECNLDEVPLGNRVARVEAFPMGINYELYHEAPTHPEAGAFTKKLERIAASRKVILSVDRLDYSKGILFRLEGFAAFLENNPEYRGKVTLLLIVVPSRDQVDMYADLKTQIDKAVGAINGAYTAVGWIPVHYFYRSFSFAELTALYNIADIALVTPLRDGMNLVAKEYLAAKRDRPGVLILSEMAGAAVELSDALIVNPMDTKDIADALLTALTMPEEEQTAALRRMQKLLSRRNVARWAEDFIVELGKTRSRNDELAGKVLGEAGLSGILEAYQQAEKRLLVLDYDGTLAPFVKDPSQAKPTRLLRETLARLAADPRNKVVICSGRDKETLDAWLGDLGVGLSAEHGIFYTEDGLWRGEAPEPVWNEEILGILEHITDKTPRSKIEVKKTALVWHYRQVDPWPASLRGDQLVKALVPLCTRLGLQIMRGNKIIEIKPADRNKGNEVGRLLEKDRFDFILGMGDDVTDEDMFAAMPEGAVTIKVGGFSDSAGYTLPSQAGVVPFLTALARAGEGEFAGES